MSFIKIVKKMMLFLPAFLLVLLVGVGAKSFAFASPAIGSDSTSDVTYELSSGTIKGKTSTSGGGVYLPAGEFILSGKGQIMDCTATDGGAVYANKVKITGGSITGCSATGTSTGGIVYAKDSITMTGGTIEDNIFPSGGVRSGVLISQSGNINIYGGTISGNEYSQYCVICGGTSLLISNAEISNTEGMHSGAVAVKGNSISIGPGSSIVGVEGAVVASSSSTMSGGDVNTYRGYGITCSSSFRMLGGTITSEYGSSIYISSNSGSFYYAGGTIESGVVLAVGPSSNAYIYFEAVPETAFDVTLQNLTVTDGTIVARGSSQSVLTSALSKINITNSLSNGLKWVVERSGSEYVIVARIQTFTVRFSVNDSTMGSVSPTSISAKYGTTFSANSNKLTFSYGGTTTATITASTKSILGYSVAFSRWSSTSGTVTSDLTITATFSKTKTAYAITFTPSSSSLGTVSQSSLTLAMTGYTNTLSISGNKITITQQGSSIYDKTVYTIIASPRAGCTFVNWTGPISSGNITRDCDFVANFTGTPPGYLVFYKGSSSVTWSAFEFGKSYEYPAGTFFGLYYDNLRIQKPDNTYNMYDLSGVTITPESGTINSGSTVSITVNKKTSFLPNVKDNYENIPTTVCDMFKAGMASVRLDESYRPPTMVENFVTKFLANMIFRKKR